MYWYEYKIVTFSVTTGKPLRWKRDDKIIAGTIK